MILPNTTYHTYEDMPIRIQETSKLDLSHWSLVFGTLMLGSRN